VTHSAVKPLNPNFMALNSAVLALLQTDRRTDMAELTQSAVLRLTRVEWRVQLQCHLSINSLHTRHISWHLDASCRQHLGASAGTDRVRHIATDLRTAEIWTQHLTNTKQQQHMPTQVLKSKQALFTIRGPGRRKWQGKETITQWGASRRAGQDTCLLMW